MRRARTPIAERFEDKVVRSGFDSCWWWVASRSVKGYGRINRGGAGGPVEHAHRIAFEMYVGPIPEGMSVLHRCDTPPCVNPVHLFVGTSRDNSIDMARKGRQHVQKLAVEQVRSIKSALVDGETHRNIARRYGVSKSTVTAISTGQNWAHVGEP